MVSEKGTGLIDDNLHEILRMTAVVALEQEAGWVGGKRWCRVFTEVEMREWVYQVRAENHQCAIWVFRGDQRSVGPSPSHSGPVGRQVHPGHFSSP